MAASTPAPSTITVRLLLFGPLREGFGQREADVTLPSTATGEELLDALSTRHPSVAAYRSVVRLAVNEAYAPVTVELHDGDVIALIPPVSGG